MRYRSRVTVVEAVKLEWQHWNDVCELVGVGSLSEGKPEGCWVDPDDGSTYQTICPPNHLSIEEAELGLLIPTPEGQVLARQGEWIVKDRDKIYSDRPEVFERTFEPVPQNKGVQAVKSQVGARG